MSAVGRLVVALALAGAAVACRGEDAKPPVDAGAGQGGGSGNGIGSGSGGAKVAGVDAGVDAGAAVVPPAVPPAARIERVVWRAVDNRAMAHRASGEDVVIDAGTFSFARFTRYGLPVSRWQLAQLVDGEAAAIGAPLSSLEIPLSEDQARTADVLALRLHASEPTSLTLKLNGRKPRRKAIELAAGWQNVAQELPPGWLVAGGNQLVLEHSRRKATLALAWVRAGTGRDLSSPLAAVRFVERRLELATGHAAAWYITVPEGGHLRAQVAAPCRVLVRATTSDGSFVGGKLGGERGDAGEGERVDLSSFAGRVVRLELRAEPADLATGATAAGSTAAPPGARCEVARIEEPVITVHGPEAPPPPAGKPPRFVVLWVLDATRADRIPAFTPGAPVIAPVFDELTRTSAVFRQYYTQGNESQTSHSTVWTGVYPAIHNVRLAGVGGSSRIPQRLPVIAELLGKAGLATTGVTGNGFVTDDGGYTRGFEEFRNMMREKGVINGTLLGETILSAALGRLEAHRDRPTFLFFGTVDSHSPWIARQPWMDRYSALPYEGPFKSFGDGFALGFRRGKMGCSKIPPPKDIERLRAIYDSTISYSDDLIGKFIAQLKIWNIWDETMLIITADHGDELFEHSRCGHGGSLRDTLVRVPLLIHYPAQFPAAIIEDQGAEGVDILPTILDALGAPPLASAQGRSLRPLVAGEGRGWTSPSYASQYEYAHAMRLGRWKIAVNIRNQVNVFDMREDLYEERDLSASRPVERRMLADHLGLFLATRARWQKASWGVVSSITAEGARLLDGPAP